jgi:predicted RNase H-like nuclease (RuvC/YqgF family)
MARAESRTTLQLQQQLAQIRAECKRIEVTSAMRADASMHAQKLDEEALQLHSELERVNAQIARLDQRRSPNARAAPRDSSDALRNVIMLRKRNVALQRVLEKCTDPTSRIREDTGERDNQRALALRSPPSPPAPCPQATNRKSRRPSPSVRPAPTPRLNISSFPPSTHPAH